MPNDASLAGKGRDILLPKHGNPFKKTDSTESASANMPTVEPLEVSPADLAARFPSAHNDRNVLPTFSNAVRDLAPSDVATLFATSGAAASSSATIKSTASASAQPMTASPGSEPIHRSQSMGATEDPNTKVFDGSWLQAPPMITATGAEEALPAHDAEDEIPLVGILTPDKPAAPPQPATAPVSATPSSSPSIRRPATIMPFTPSMTPSTSQPKPVESRPSTATPKPTLAERLTPPSAKPADAGFKPTNPFASADAKPPSAPVSPPAGSDSDKALVDFAAGSSPSEPTTSSPSLSMSRLSFSALSDSLATTSHLAGSGLPMPPVVEQEAMIKFLITDERVDELWRRIEAVEKRVVDDNYLGSGVRRGSLDNIRGARNLLLGGKQNYEDALRYVVEVESDLTQATRLKSWSLSYGVMLLFYNVAWLVALGVLLTYSKQATTMFAGSGVDQTFFITILCGGLGGVSGALRSMWVHIAKDRDFDPQFLIWYLINPILGAVLAIFAFWVAQLGLVAVTGTGTSGSGVFVFYVLGWLVGFQQNVAYQLVEQAIKMFFKREDSGKALPAGASSEPSSIPTTPEVKSKS